MKDSTTERLIQILMQDAWQSSLSLSKQLHLSPITVRRRIAKLLEKGIIRIVAVTNPPEGAPSFVAIIAIDVIQNKIKEVIQQLANRPEVVWCSPTTGRFDILTMVRFASNEDLYKFIQDELPTIEGIKDSETFICLHMKRGRYIPRY